VLFNQVQTIRGHYWIEPLTIGYVIQAANQILIGPFIPDRFALLAVCALPAGLILLTVHGFKTKRISLLVLVWGPLALVLMVSLIQPVLLYRGLIGMLPPLALLAGAALASAGRRGRLVGAALLVPLAAGLVMLIGVNQNGSMKQNSFYYQPETTQPVVHLSDSTMVFAQGPNNYRLESGCPGERGSLSELTRQALGWPSIRMEDLPDTYFLQVTLYPLSTTCHEQVIAELTRGAKLVYRHDRVLGTYGVWLHED
jgi:hypothetical protein